MKNFLFFNGFYLTFMGSHLEKRSRKRSADIKYYVIFFVSTNIVI